MIVNYTFINNLLTILVAVITLVTAIQKEHAFYKTTTHTAEDSKETSMNKQKKVSSITSDMPPRMQLKIQEDVSNNLTRSEQNKLLLNLVQNTNTQVETLSTSMNIIQQNVLSSNSRLDHIDSQLNELNQRVTTLENHATNGGENEQ